MKPRDFKIVVQAEPRSEYLVRMGGYFPPDIWAAFKDLVQATGGRWNGVKGEGSAYRFTALGIGKLVLRVKQGGTPFTIYVTDDETRRVLGLQVETEKSASDAHLGAMLSFDRVLSERERKIVPAKLYEYQRIGARFLASRRTGLLCDEPGLGKTLQSLMALSARSPLVIVCPASVKGSWAAEIEKWRPGAYRVTQLEGRGSFSFPEDGEAVVVNYDILDEEISASPRLHTTLIADEVHMVKSRSASRTARFRQVVRAVLDGGGYAWGMTATPLMNEPEELYSLLRLFDLDKEVFGSYLNFYNLFGGRKDKYTARNPATGLVEEREVTVLGKPVQDIKPLLSRVMLRREKRDVLKELPPKRYRTVRCSLNEDALAVANELQAALRTAGIPLSEWETAAAEVARARGKVSFNQISRARERIAAAKIPAMLVEIERFKKEGKPLVLFSEHKAPVAAAAARPRWAAITGSVKNKERTEIVRRFQAGELEGVACTIKAAGTGLTLTHAADALFVDYSWTPAALEQAEDRIHRVGQQKDVWIHALVGDHPLEERVAELLQTKNEIIGATLR